MRRLTIATIALLVTAFGAVTASAAAPSTAPGQNKIVCFQSGAATCTVNTNGAKGSVTFTVTGPGAASAYYVGYNNSVYGVKLGNLTQLSFQYTGDAATAGAPRFSIPIDQNDDGYTEAFAFVPAISCNNGQGKVDVIGDSTCLVYYAPDGVTGWANWAAFAAAHPTYEVSALDNYVFPISDEPGTWTLNQVTIGKPGK
jgi:hypothetical protein